MNVDVRSRLRASCLGPRSEVVEPGAVLGELLEMLRSRLHMDLAWLGRLEGDLLVMQVLSGNAAAFRMSLGSSLRREDSLYAKVLADELPSLLPDLRADPRTSHVPAVVELGMGSYAATPVTDREGRVYGMLGCCGKGPCLALHESDGGFLRLLAAFLTEFVIDLRRLWDARNTLWLEISDLLDRGGPRMLFQPIFDMATGRAVAVEALARFPGLSHGPDDLFTAATHVGLSFELEMAAVRNALRALPALQPPLILAVNASPATVMGGLIDAVVGSGSPARLAVEITEHDHIGDSEDLLLATEALRGHGTHIAVDDVGSCYSGLEQLLHLRPEVIKMDQFITHGIDGDPARRAVAAGLTKVAAEIDGRVVAEGIESRAEFAAVVDAGIGYGQGNLLRRPTDNIEEAGLGIRLPAATAAANGRGPRAPRSRHG